MLPDDPSAIIIKPQPSPPPELPRALYSPMASLYLPLIIPNRSIPDSQTVTVPIPDSPIPDSQRHSTIVTFLAPLRSLLFYIVAIIITAILCPFYSLGAILNLPRNDYFAILISMIYLFCARYILGIHCRIHNQAGLTEKAPVLFACKHQSSWEILFFLLAIPHIAAIYKRGLLWIFFVSLYLMRYHIPINRKKTTRRNLRQLKSHINRAVGRSILIFPEGTRTQPGAKTTYLSGVYMIYRQASIACVPVAVNSGLFWSKRFTKYPGTIHIEILTPILPGMKADAFMSTLSQQIETATQRLIDQPPDGGHPLSLRRALRCGYGAW